MNIRGYAFQDNEAEIRERFANRYEEIKHIRKTLQINITPAYGEGAFSGVLQTEEEKQLTEFDLCLLADQGNLCFGGHCTIIGNKFSGGYWTD